MFVKKYAVVYDSMTGNTKMLADEIEKIMGKNECTYFGTAEACSADLSADIVFAGFWTDKGDCSEKMAGFLEKLENQNIFLFGTAGFGGAEEYFQKILEKVEAHLPEGNRLAGSYMCQGKMPESVKKRYEAMQEQDPENVKIKMMIENFDRALSHPDQRDLDRLAEKLAKLN